MGLKHVLAEDGARLAYRDDGAGPVVLALPGLTRDGRDFDRALPALHDVRLIRLDSRGRGGSDWTGADSYTVPQETRDALTLMDRLGIARFAVLGASRGGLIGLVLAALAKPRLTGLCLVDVGPVVERAGLVRIGETLGLPPRAQNLQDAADGLAAGWPGFARVPRARWLEEAARLYHVGAHGLSLPYDPALRQSFEAAMAAPPVDLWPFFQAATDLPLALIRGAGSDLLSVETATRMQALAPGMIRAEVPDRGHIPFLDEPESQAALRAWRARLPG